MLTTSNERATEPQPLAPRQRELLSYLYTFTRLNGYQPSYREMMERFGMKSINAPKVHLIALKKKGWIETSPGDSRCIRFVFRPDGRRFEGFADR